MTRLASLHSKQLETDPSATEKVMKQVQELIEKDLDNDTIAAAIFKDLHAPLVGHPSIRETIDLMSSRCDIPKYALKQLVIKLMAKCPGCTKSRDTKRKATLERHTISSFKPFQTFQADVITGLPTSREGFSKILVFICTFSRFIFLIPIRAESEDEACSEIKKKMIAVASDFAQANEDTWPKILPIASRQINAHIHSATGTSPYQIIFGTELTRDMKLLQSDAPFTPLSELPFTPEFIRDLDNNLKFVYDRALAHLEDTIVTNYEKAPESLTRFSVGDYVLYRNLRITTSKLGKFSPLFVGPFKIITILISEFYECKDLVQDVTYFCHARDLRPFSCDDEEAIKIASSDQNEFVLDKVIGHEGDPHLLSMFRFLITFKDDPHTVHKVRLRDIQLIPMVREYALKHKELNILADKLKPREEVLTRRTRQTSSRLIGTTK